jgi:hypothetical protein
MIPVTVSYHKNPKVVIPSSIKFSDQHSPMFLAASQIWLSILAGSPMYDGALPLTECRLHPDQTQLGYHLTQQHYIFYLYPLALLV